MFHADRLARGRFLFKSAMKEELVSRMQHPPRPIPPWLGMHGFASSRLGGANTYHNYTTALYVLVRDWKRLTGPKENMTRRRRADRVSQRQAQVARLVRPPATTDRHAGSTDREPERFARIHMRAKRHRHHGSGGLFAELTADAIGEIFELELGLFWPTDPDGVPQADAVALTGIDRGDISAGRSCRGSARTGFSASGRDLGCRRRTVPRTGGAGSWCWRRARVDRAAVRLRGRRHPAGSGDFHRGLAPEQGSCSRCSPNRWGALLQNRADQTTILAQIDQLRVEGGAAESGPGRSGGLWDWDLTSDAVYFSPRWKAMLGCEPDEIEDVFSEWEDRIHPDDLDAAQRRGAGLLWPGGCRCTKTCTGCGTRTVTTCGSCRWAG